MRTKLFGVFVILIVWAAALIGQTRKLATETAGNWSTGNVTHAGSLSISGTFTGNGGGLTNTPGQTLTWATNAASATATIDLTLAYAGLATNNNINIAGLTGINASANTVQWATRFYTNTSGSTKTITVPASFIGTDTTLYLTNQGVLSVTLYPGFGTNALWKCLK